MKNVFFLMLFFVVSCEQHELVNPEVAYESAGCGTADPLQELDWLKAKVEEMAAPLADSPCQLYSVIQGVYKGKPVFVPVVNGALCCPCAGNPVYSCEGELLFVCDPEEEAKVEDEKVIWQQE